MEGYFNDYTTKKYATYNIHDDAFNPEDIVINSNRIDFSNKTYGGFKTVAIIDEDDNYARCSLRLHNVGMSVNKMTMDEKTSYSLIVRFDMTNDQHRTAVKKLRDMYEHVFRLVANRDANPHIVLKPFNVKGIESCCKKKKLSKEEQDKLDDEVSRAFDFEKIVKGLELDNDGNPLPSCTPVLFLNIPWGSKFKATIRDIGGDDWTPETLLKKKLRGGVSMQLGILSFSSKGVKWHLDANLIHIKKIEVSDAFSEDIKQFEESITEEERQQFIEEKKKLRSSSPRVDNQEEQLEGAQDDDRFPEEEGEEFNFE